MGRLMRINLSESKVAVEDLSKEYRGLGGRGLSSQIVGREVPPKADPLGPENKLIFSAGILAGTAVPNTGRLSVGAKSPLTNGVKEANAGGSAAQKIARLGLQAVVIEGRAKELTLLRIDKNGATFIPASSLKGVGNYELIERMKKEHGNKISIVSIGPAGEMRLKAASVMVTTPDFHIRVAARGGLGAVMGSKNLKALVIDDTGSHPVEAKDKAKFREAMGAASKAILADPLGTGVQRHRDACFSDDDQFLRVFSDEKLLPRPIRRGGEDFRRIHGRADEETAQRSTQPSLHGRVYC